MKQYLAVIVNFRLNPEKRFSNSAMKSENTGKEKRFPQNFFAFHSVHHIKKPSLVLIYHKKIFLFL